MTDNPLLEAALFMAARHIPVFPCKNMPWDEIQHKAPLTGRGGFYKATTDAAQITLWWTDHPDALIGMPTGEKSRLAVLDLDLKKGKNGYLHVPDWESLSPFIVKTGSGGAHLYFRNDERLYTKTDALAPGVDIKAARGYIIVPPSPGYTTLKGSIWDALPRWPEHLMPPERTFEVKPGAQPQAHIDDVRDALGVIPNDDESWDDWKKIGLATWAATGGSAEGREAFRVWSEKSGKYDRRGTENAWDQISRSPPTSIGFGTLFHLACDADPEWKVRWRTRQDERWAVEEAAIVAEMAAAASADRVEDHLAWIQERKAERSTATSQNDASDEGAPQPHPESGSTAPEPEQPAPESAPKGSPRAEKKSRVIRAKPFNWIDPKLIPPRRWLYKPSYVRGYASLIGGATGAAKSSLTIVEALAMASGRALLGVKPEGKLRVWIHNGEDPADELQRRIVAAMILFGIQKDEIDGQLFVTSGRETEIVIAREGDRGQSAVLNNDAYGQLVSQLRFRSIDVLILDPLVASHRVNENDNMAMELVAKGFARIADETNCAVMLVHHAKKTYGEDVRTDDVRGASALAAAVRDVRTLNVMSEADAVKAKVSKDDRRLHLRLDRGKSNLMRPAASADWFKLESIDLGNGEGDDKKGDSVGVVRSWTYPQPTYADMTPGKIRRCLDAVKAGGPWRADHRAQNEPWIGAAIASTLSLDVDKPSDRDAIKKMIADWLGKGLLKAVRGQDSARQPRTYVTVGRDPATVEDTEPF